MSTRGAIAKPHGDGWIGVYQHYDSYPHGLGKALWWLYHWVFAGDVELMQAELIDAHPGGWSNIGCEETATGGRVTGECYCHSRGGQDPDMILTCRCPADNSECNPLFIEWAYVLSEGGMLVAKGWPTAEKDEDGITVYVHKPVRFLRWAQEEPDWDALTDHVYERIEAETMRLLMGGSHA